MLRDIKTNIVSNQVENAQLARSLQDYNKQVLQPHVIVAKYMISKIKQHFKKVTLC